MEPLLHMAMNSLDGNVLPWCRKLLEQELFEDCGFQSDGSSQLSHTTLLPARKLADFRNQLSLFGEDVFLSPFLQSILCRSVKWLRGLINHENPEMEYLENIHPVVLAVGWPEGLKILIEAGFWCPEALNIAIGLGDTESLRVLLGAMRAFATPDRSQHQDLMLHEGSSTVKEMLVSEFRSRWLRLAQFYSASQDGEELEISRLQSGTNTNYDPDQMWTELEINGVDTPKDLNCCGWKYGVATAIHQLDLFFSAGLRNLDGRLQERPPILTATVRDIGLTQKITRWFLDHGADPNFPYHAQNIHPNLLFYVYSEIRPSDIESNQNYDAANQRDLDYDLTRFLDKCDPSQSDDCHCFCSTSGCLPVKSFWKYCDVHDYDLPCAFCQVKKPANWTSFIALFSTKFIPLTNLQMGTYYREACRMELFDRLNMTHTCCQYGDLVETRWRHTITNDRESIQEEESELYKQLDLLLQAYDTGNGARKNSLDGFWQIWWAKIDEILPPIPAEERCGRIHWRDSIFWREFNDQGERHEMAQRRLRRELECLESRGYEGWDFYDVIRHHLAEFLEATEVFHECL